MRKALLAIALLAGGIYLWNASWLAPNPPAPGVSALAHRGVHQTFDLAGVTAQSCTATVIHPPTHTFIENTIPSISAAFGAGATVVELDVQLSQDNQWIVFHDATLDCRTNGTGAIADHTMAELKKLDVGYGYTADAGETYPLRGSGVGLMPTLDEVFKAFPHHKFLINFKTNQASEGIQLAQWVAQNPDRRANIWSVYGGDRPTAEANARLPGLNGFGARQTKDCLIRYIGLGWTGYVPQSCRQTHVIVPINVTWAIWGWPKRFLARMRTVGSDVILIGPYAPGDAGTSGIDDPALLGAIPPSFSGLIWTNRIERLGPEIAHRF